LAYDLDLRTSPTQVQSEPLRQMSVAKIISFESYRPDTQTNAQANDYSTRSPKWSVTKICGYCHRQCNWLHWKTGLQNDLYMGVKWRHDNLWSRYDLCVVRQHGVLREVKWW